MSDDELIEIFDASPRIKLGLGALLSVGILAAYVLFGSRYVSSSSFLVDNLIISALSVLSFVIILSLIHISEPTRPY